MKKMIAVLKRKPGMSFEDFRTYYDTRHVPLVKGLMGDNLINYVRNYVDSDSPFAVGVKLDFDCVTEFHFVDDAAFERAVKAVEHPDNAPKVRADELNFLDMSYTKVAIVNVHDRTDGKPGLTAKS